MESINVAASTLRRLIAGIFTAVKVPPADATTVATALVRSDLRGMASHGVSRVPRYVGQIAKGEIVPGAQGSTVLDLGPIRLFEAGFNFGQVSMAQIIEAAKVRASETGAIITLANNLNHIGEAGQYAWDLACDGFVSLLVVNVVGVPRVAPFGACEPIMGTNPISVGFPRAGSPLVVDAATCDYVEGKVNVAKIEGKRLPHPFLVDRDGSLTDNPNRLYEQPTAGLLPLGGLLSGQKGSAFSVACDLLAGILSGSGFAKPGAPLGRNGLCLMVIDPRKLPDHASLLERVEEYAQRIKAARPLPGVEQVLLPGEKEQLLEAQRELSGVPLSGALWTEIAGIAKRLQVELAD